MVTLQTTPFDLTVNLTRQGFDDILTDPSVHRIAKENLLALVKFCELLATPLDEPTPKLLRTHLIQTYPPTESPRGLVRDERLNWGFTYLLKALGSAQVLVQFTNTPGDSWAYSAKPALLTKLRLQGHSKAQVVWLLPNNFNMQAANDNVNFLHRLVTQGLLISKGVQRAHPGEDCLELPASQFREIRHLAGQLMYLFWLGGAVNTFALYPTEDLLLYLLSQSSTPVRNAVANALVRLNPTAARAYKVRDTVAVLSLLLSLRRTNAPALRSTLKTVAGGCEAKHDLDGHLFQILDGFLASS